MSIISFVLMIVSLIGLDSVTFLGFSPVVRVLVKSLTSVFFLITGFIASKSSIRSDKTYNKFILSGLFLGLLGDVFLGLDFISIIYFVIGLISFAAGHILYVIAFSKKYSKLEIRNIVPLCIILPGFFALVFITKKFDFQGVFPCIVFYAVILSIMCGKVLSLLHYREKEPKFVTLTVVGAFLFAISDIILLFILFMPMPIEVKRVLEVINLTSYYIGQGFIALSISY